FEILALERIHLLTGLNLHFHGFFLLEGIGRSERRHDDRDGNEQRVMDFSLFHFSPLRWKRLKKTNCYIERCRMKMGRKKGRIFEPRDVPHDIPAVLSL